MDKGFTIAGNEIWQIVILFGFIVFGFGAGKLLKYLLNKRASEIEATRALTATGIKGFGKSAPFLTFSIGLVTGASFLTIGAAEEFISTIIAIILTLAVAWTAHCLVDVPKLWLINRASETPGKLDDMLAPIIAKSLSATVVVLATVQIAQILSGKEITSILAGLGIGSLAFALAAQDTIKNFFGSLVILSDRPFEVGERILVDGTDGIIETVGMRSTRVRTLTGHLVTIPNGELANKSIENISKRPHIRRLFNIGITYDTPPQKVKEAKSIVEDILKDHEGMDEEFPPKVYFNNFDESSLNLFIIYWYHPAAYWDFLQFAENVNMQILERFNAAGIDFAFPTQTLHLAGDTSRPLEVGISK